MYSCEVGMLAVISSLTVFWGIRKLLHGVQYDSLGKYAWMKYYL